MRLNSETLPSLKKITGCWHYFVNQHAEFVANPKQELQLALVELEENPIFRQRFQDIVTPMVFNTEPHDFDVCFASFKGVAGLLIEAL